MSTIYFFSQRNRWVRRNSEAIIQATKCLKESNFPVISFEKNLGFISLTNTRDHCLINGNTKTIKNLKLSRFSLRNVLRQTSVFGVKRSAW